MNDETKAALAWARGAVESHDLYRGARDERDGSVENMRSILAHIDGEPARLAAAREEQREACALDAEERVGCASTYDEIRSVPLDATPLADELDEAQRGEREAWRQVDEVRTERDALRARVAELEAQLGGMTEQWKAELNHANAWMRKFRAAEAQVAAARAECASIIKYTEDDGRHSAATDILEAMDEAAK